MDQFLAQTNPEEVNITGLKSQIASYFIKINGNNKVCHGDLYNDGTDIKKAVIICLNSNEDFGKLSDLFSKLNPNDLVKENENIDPRTEQTFVLHFTDGLEAFSNKTITFKSDGLYEVDKLLFKYQFLEVMDGKKCNVYHNLPIFPIKFLDSELLSSKCLLKFKYNQVETYVATKEKNCEEITKYIAIKMRTGCINYINGEGNIYSNDLVSRPTEGKWTGWSYYHKILDNGGHVVPELFKVEILPEKINIYDQSSNLKETIDYHNIEWNCNHMGECNIWEYLNHLTKTFQKLKINDVHLALKKMKEVWNLQDVNFCFIIDEKDTHVICPRDVSEEVNARKSLAVAVDMKLYDAESKVFGPFPNNKTFYITKVSDSDPYIKDYVIKVKEDKVYLNDNDMEGEIFLEYLDMRPKNEVPCGIQFRHISLPIAYHEVDPICCAMYQTNENNYICVQHQAQCYIILRKLIQTIRKNCLAVNKMLPDKDVVNTPVSPISPKKFDESVKAWSGEIIFNEIDNYKYKGEVDIKTGFLKVTDNSIIIMQGESISYDIDLVTLKFICLGDYLCRPEEYIRHQELFLEKNYDREWQESTFSKFWAANPKINQNDCTVVTSEDSEKEVSQMILVCTSSKDEGKRLRNSISDIYNKKISKLSQNSSESSKIPPANLNAEFEAEVITTSIDGLNISAQTSSTIIKVMGSGLIFKASGSSIISYEELVDPKTLNIVIYWNSALQNTPKEKLKNDIDPSMCLAVLDIGGLINICMKNKIRGYFDKASLYQALKLKAQARSIDVKKMEEEQQFIGSISPEDPFDFGRIPKFKRFSKDFNLDTLSDDTFEISKIGIWEGWVYEGPLTERNFKKIFTPVFCKIADGFIEFKTEEGKPSYKKLKLEEYEQLCFGHCKPNEYLDHTKKYKNDVDDNMYLEKTINNYLGQMKYPYINEACVVMDFISPIFQFGQQQIICAVDKTQGEKIRLAIENLYYTSLLNLNMEKSVRIPNTNTDRYFGRLIINDKLVKEFNNFFIDNYGLVGHLVYEKIGSTQRITNNVFNITYNQIDNDNFGTSCAFWYKNLKIKQRNEEMKKIITDNNCCFRFYTKKDRRKIEMCAFNPDNRICIKQARELMKGLKFGCTEEGRKGSLPNNVADDQKDESLDVYQKNTLDDNENGIFEGFVFFANAINSSQSPRSNPHFIKVGSDSLDFYDDHKQKKAKFSISIDTFHFDCKDSKPCNPENFLKYAQTHQKYISLVNQIKTIFNIFKDTYSLNEKLFQENCFILETVTFPILMCSYMPGQASIIKMALMNSFKLRFLTMKLTSVREPEQGKNYKIIFRKGLAESTDDVFLNMNGVFSKNTNNLIFDYRELDNDPVTGTRCAIYYKYLKPNPLNLNDSPNLLLLKNSCCFKYFLKGQKYYICSNTKEGKCTSESFSLMKSIWNGCRFSNPNQEIVPHSPDAEILGQLVYIPKIRFDIRKTRYDIQPLERINLIFKKEMIKRKFFIDSYNEISFSKRRSLYHGWVNIYPINIDPETKTLTKGKKSKPITFQILKYFARLTPETFSFYENSHPNSQAKLVIRPDMLSMVCDKGLACLPHKFINSFLIKYNPMFVFYKQFFKTKIDFYELGKEDGCSVLENFIDDEAKYFVICPRIKFHRTMSRTMQARIDSPDSTFTKNRIMLSATYGKILREIIYNAYLTARKFVRSDILFDLKKPIEFGKISLLLKKEEYTNININDLGVTANGQNILKFDDLPTCFVQYNLVYVPEDMYEYKSRKVFNNRKSQCCMRYNGPVSQEYACFGSLNCEYVTYEFATKFNSFCRNRRNRQNDDLYNEFNAGNNVSLKPLIKRLFKEELNIPTLKVFENNKEISTQDNIIKQKSLIIKYMYELRDIMHEINKIEIISSKKLNSSPQDTTSADPISQVLDPITPKYIGYNANRDWEIKASRNRITEYVNAKKVYNISIIRENQYVRTKEFFAVIAENSKYVLLQYEDNKQIHLAEISSKISLFETFNELDSMVYQSNNIVFY